MSPQDHAIEKLAAEHGRLYVAPPYSDGGGTISATAPNGQEYLIGEDGFICKMRINNSVDWSL